MSKHLHLGNLKGFHKHLLHMHIHKHHAPSPGNGLPRKDVQSFRYKGNGLQKKHIKPLKFKL